MKKNLLLIIVSLCALLLVGVASFAWYYFPSSKNLIIDTDDYYDLEIEYYHLIKNDDGTYSMQLLDDEDDEEKDNNFTVSTVVEFFQWGGEYICETDSDDYYCLVCSCDSTSYSDGFIKAMIESTCFCSSTFKDLDTENHDGKDFYVRFPLVSVDYKLASSNSLDPFSQTTISELLSSNGYQGAEFVSEDNDTTKETAEYNSTGECYFNEGGISTNQYLTEKIIEEETVETIKFIIFLKVSPDGNFITNEMNNVYDTGDALTMNITNTVEISIKLRSVPQKPVTESTGD